MTANERLAFIRRIAKTHCSSHQDFTKYTGYLRDTVSDWFTSCCSLSHRYVYSRVVNRLLLELAKVQDAKKLTTPTLNQMVNDGTGAQLPRNHEKIAYRDAFALEVSYEQH
ncbi:hypothetical protein D3C80_936990 [compost metagenome]